MAADDVKDWEASVVAVKQGPGVEREGQRKLSGNLLVALPAGTVTSQPFIACGSISLASPIIIKRHPSVDATHRW
ncbi:hypothetical protein ACNKHK_03050 [Shigella flexneri]